MAEIVLLLTTVPDDDRADELARTLIAERLAACVNLHAPMTSVYRWNGVIERDRERQLVVKTTADRVDALRSRIAALHRYELPEIVVVSVDGGSEAYLAWVAEETRSG